MFNQIPFVNFTQSNANTIQTQHVLTQPKFLINQYQIQQASCTTHLTNSKPKWSISINNTTTNTTTTTATTTANTNNIQSTNINRTHTNNHILNEQLHDDEHFNRHMENLIKNDEENNFSLIIEEQEEINESQFKKLISKTNKIVDQQVEKQVTVELINEEEDDMNNNDEEPKVFQDEEEVDLIPETNSNPVILNKSIPVTTSKTPTLIANSSNNTNLSKPNLKLILDKPTSVMPTPLAYSRSSSLTSLNSFDVKSIHSSVASEYSHVPVKIKNRHNLENSQLDILDDETEDDEDIDCLMPDSPAAPDSSFLKAQRIKHKLNQVECRQNAMLPLIKEDQPSLKPWQLSTNTDLNSLMTRLNLNQPIKTVNETEIDSKNSNLQFNQMHTYHGNTPPVKLIPTPKIINQNPVISLTTQPSIQTPPPPVMSVTYAFLKNNNNNNNNNNSQTYVSQPPPQLLPPQIPLQSQPLKFLMSNPQYVPPPPPPQISQPIISQINLNKSPKNLDQFEDEDRPKVYSFDNRYNRIKSLQSSPQESVCSRMSDASIPSLIKQDISSSNQTLKTVLANNSNLTRLNPNLRVLFQNFSQQNQYENKNLNDNRVLLSSSSSSSASSCSSVVPKFMNQNQQLIHETNEQNESFTNNLDITTKPMNTPAGFASISGASLIDVDSDEDEHNEQETKENNQKRDFIINKTQSNLTSNHQNEINQTRQETEPCFIDFDLENFINENFQPAKSINTSLDETDRIYNHKNNLNIKSFKRASLQSLDLTNFNHQSNKIQKSSIQTTRKAQIQQPIQVTKQISKPTISKQQKRLSEDNSSNLTLNQNKNIIKQSNLSNRTNRTNSQSVNTSTSILGTSTNSVTNKTGPIVNMTKTAQLRASKLASTTSNTINSKKSTVTSNQSTQSTKTTSNKPINKTVLNTKQKDDKLNQTINNNNENMFHSEYNQLNNVQQSSSTCASYHQHLQHLNQTRRKSFSFGSSFNSSSQIGIKKETTTSIAKTKTTLASNLSQATIKQSVKNDSKLNNKTETGVRQSTVRSTNVNSRLGVNSNNSRPNSNITKAN